MIDHKFRAIMHYLAQKLGSIIPELPVRPILITGTHRGGTTFVGTVLAQADELRYVYEPLSPWFDDLSRDTHCPVCHLDLNTWYPYIHKGNEAPYRAHFKHFNNSKRLFGKQPLYKDPLSPFSAEWLHKTYHAKVVFILRNPLALVASCKNVDWGVPFDRLAHQSALLDKYIPKYKKQAIEYSKQKHSKLEETALLYNMVYEKAYELSKAYPDWIFIKHEDLNANPQPQFKQLFKQLGLEYSPLVEAKVRELTSAKNTADSDKKRIHSLHRASKDVSNLWKKRLSKDEIAYIKKTCGKVASLHGYKI